MSVSLGVQITFWIVDPGLACLGKFLCAPGGERKKEQYGRQGAKEGMIVHHGTGCPGCASRCASGGEYCTENESCEGLSRAVLAWGVCLSCCLEKSNEGKVFDISGHKSPLADSSVCLWKQVFICSLLNRSNYLPRCCTTTLPFRQDNTEKINWLGQKGK